MESSNNNITRFDSFDFDVVVNGKHCEDGESPGTPLSFSKFGIDNRQGAVRTCLGKIRTLGSLSGLERLFLISSGVGMGTVLVLLVVKMALVTPKSTEFAFSLVLSFNILFCLYYLIHGVFCERPYELTVLVIGTTIDWVYLALNYCFTSQDTLKLVRLIITSLFGIGIITMGIILILKYHQSKNLIFRTVGANAELQNMCHVMYVYIGVLKADLQVSVTLGVLECYDSNGLMLKDYLLMPLALLVGIFTYFTGYFSMRLESKKMAIAYIICWNTIPVYVLYLIVQASLDLIRGRDDVKLEKEIYAVLFVACATSIIMRSLSLYCGIRAYKNFGKGLRQKVFGNCQSAFSNDAPVFTF
ncbi:uncharacterized protein LOC128246948 [Mya arenaria]|uniref:uncharacterized protein LOC128246948 n=1 Tax=Mya arenaria TaxID=6604 RepID=UPI0022E81DEA|nr:uncharacterized protein LOC128246948 [Mya arenaria]